MVRRWKGEAGSASPLAVSWCGLPAWISGGQRRGEAGTPERSSDPKGGRSASSKRAGGNGLRRRTLVGDGGGRLAGGPGFGRDPGIHRPFDLWGPGRQALDEPRLFLRAGPLLGRGT